MAPGDSDNSSDESKDAPKDSTETPTNSSLQNQGDSRQITTEGAIDGSETTENQLVDNTYTESLSTSDKNIEESPIAATSPEDIHKSTPASEPEYAEPSSTPSPGAEYGQDPSPDRRPENPEGYGPDISYIRSVWEARLKRLSQKVPEETKDESNVEDFEPPIQMFKILDPVISREEWGALLPKQPPTPRDGDVSRMMCLPTKTDACYSGKECTKVIRDLQKELIHEKNEDDLPYNFLVGGDGRIYEGLGWKAKSPYPFWMPSEYNDGRVFSVGFVGPYGGLRNPEKPPEHMIHARRLLTRYGVENQHIGRGLEVMTVMLGKI